MDRRCSDSSKKSGEPQVLIEVASLMQEDLCAPEIPQLFFVQQVEEAKDEACSPALKSDLDFSWNVDDHLQTSYDTFFPQLSPDVELVQDLFGDAYTQLLVF